MLGQLVDMPLDLLLQSVNEEGEVRILLKTRLTTHFIRPEIRLYERIATSAYLRPQE